jgi:hypothetical protein
MTRTGPRSCTETGAPGGACTDGRRPRAPAVAACALLALSLAWAGGAAALDVFTLWQQPEAPLRIAPGCRADYQGTTLEAGRRQVDVVRIQCVGESETAWLIEILPLSEGDAGREPLPGEGLRLALAKGLADRAGTLVEHVLAVVQWQEGTARALPPEQWRDDPLTGAFVESALVPEEKIVEGLTTRVVGEADLLCEQFTLVASDTTVITLPRGRMTQIHRREVSAAVNAAVPFLGIAYAAERTETRSELDPAGRREPPPPSVRVEIMELLDFGDDAEAGLEGLESSF